MRNIETAIFPLIFALRMCGLCVLEYPQGRPRLYLTILYTLPSWLLYIYLVVQTKIFMEKYYIEFPPILYFDTAIASIFIMLNVYYHKRFKSCLKKLDIVNDTLEELGTLRNHAQLRARTLWLIIGWIISICAINLVDSLWLFMYKFPRHYAAQCIYLPFLLNYSFHIIILNEITFLILLRYIGTLFEHVNQCIQTLIELKKLQVRLAWRTCTSSSFMHRHLNNTSQSNQHICLLMHIHFELCSISCELSRIFGPQIVMQIALYHFIAIYFTLETYDLILSTKTTFTYNILVNIFLVLFWAARYILGIIVFTYVCENVCTKANRAETFLNRLANVTFDVETQENIMQFLMGIFKRPLRISVLGLYDYGFKLVYKVYTYFRAYTTRV